MITGLPEIQAELKFSNAMLSWVQNAYTLTFGSLLLLGARSGDLLGRQRMLMIGLALFALSSVLIAMAQSPLALLGGRALQGFGAAILAPSTLALLSSYFPEGPKRIKALSWYAATAGIGASLGLVLGGLFAGLLSSGVRHRAFHPGRLDRCDNSGKSRHSSAFSGLVSAYRITPPHPATPHAFVQKP